MRIGDWIGDFLERHQGRFKPHDWPSTGTEAMDEYLVLWHSTFARNGVSEAEADAASRSLAEDPPQFFRDHIPKVIAAVKVIRVSSSPAGGNANLSDRDSAALASQGCVYCEGQGLAVVWASKPDPAKKISETSSAYCICAIGRWFEATHREKSPDMHKRIPLLANVLNGRSFWRLNPAWMQPVDTSEAVRMVPIPAAPDGRAVAASRDCPECKGTGWTERRVKWHSLDRPYNVRLFCRCPLGAWRHANDPDPRRNYENLQALPEVWDHTLSHRTWSQRPIPPSADVAEGTDGLWSYLPPGESAPIVPPPAATPPPTARKYPEWMGHVDPAVPIPAKPQPEPEPAPVPDDAGDGDDEIPFD